MIHRDSHHRHFRQAAILYNLKHRHINERPYTRTGDILIAVNPYKWFEDLYTEEKRSYYSNRLVWDTNETDPRSEMQPHVYEVSALSYRGLVDNDKDQSILVSGESGAGKTETVKICLNHIASVQRGQLGSFEEHGMDPTVKRVVQSNPLLEAFGNAKTRRNDNSSRFGKYLQLQFSREGSNDYGTHGSRAALVGSKCDVYLLEKNRVVLHESQERTFHIFYQLLAQSDQVKSRFWTGLCGKSAESFAYVGHSETDTIEGVHDSERFEETVEALALVGVNDQKLVALMQAICVVLQLGNLGFDALNGDSDKSTVSTVDELRSLAQLMGVCERDLTLSMTERTFTTSNETHKVPLKPEAAKDAADALAKEIYQKVFFWVTNTINVATAADSDKDHRTIGLLDIFGFETFPVNRFEQLCINYANEKLQQKFTEDIFRSVQAEYESERIALADIWYDDNTDVLDLIEGPTGLISMLNEECLRPKGNDNEFVHKALTLNKNSSCLVRNRTDRLSFGIKHYAGGVMYDAEGFVSKNIDTLPTDLQACTEKSSNMIISAPRIEPESFTSKARQSNINAATVWTKYRTQLNVLMMNLRKTDSRYIRCIKPNEVKKSGLMDHTSVVEQLRCAGVVAGITITRSVFPNRLPNTLVLTRFGGMAGSRGARSGGSSIEERRTADCRALLDIALKSQETVDEKGHIVKAFVVGKTKTYFRAGALEFIESKRVRTLDIHAIVIQKFARGWLSRNGGKRQRQQRRAQEEQKQRARQAEIERRAKFDRDLAERRAKHQRELQSYEDEIAMLEKRIKEEKKKGTDTVDSAKAKADSIREQNTELKEKLEEEARERATLLVKTKIQQEVKIKSARQLIEYLKKENKKLSKGYAKVTEKYEDLTEGTERLTDSFSTKEHELTDLNDESIKAEVRYESLEARFKEVQQRNKELRNKVDKYQDRYMAVAESRLELQKGLSHIIRYLQDNCTDENLYEDIFVVCREAEAGMKCEMAGLDEEPTEPALLMTSESDEEGGDDSERSFLLELL